MTILSIVSCLPAPKASSFLYVLSSFDWGEFLQGDGIDIHGIRIMVGVRWKVCLGGDLSFSQGKDAHLLSVEDLRLINPPFDGSVDGGHGEDHINKLLVKDASSTRTYSFLPASWAGDTHKETDVLPIGD